MLLEAGEKVSRTTEFDAAYLQERIDREFALPKHMGVIVESATDDGVILRAPLAPNANYKGSAFGGSLYAIAVLAGWAWITRYVAVRGLCADAVIQESHMRFVVPVFGELRACSIAPAGQKIEKFLKMLERSGRARIGLRVDMHHAQNLATVFDGWFVAARRR